MSPTCTATRAARVVRLGRGRRSRGAFISLDGVIDAPTWTFEYGFDPPSAVSVLLPRSVFSDTVLTKVLPNVHGDSSGVLGAAWLWP